ncbi:MAG: hypothetical protein JNK58_11325 [Phycisphaerae bacterium]|nr:hypothetical protein [Phycisphaerae bacterium]
MSRTAWRWVLIGVSFWVLGPLAMKLMSGVRAPDGGAEASLLLSESPLMALGACAVAFALAGAAGAAGSWAFGVRTGLFVAGLVLVWPAWEGGTVLGILRRTQSVGSLRTLGFEGVVVAVATVALGYVVARSGAGAGGRSEGVERPRRGFELADVVGPTVGLIVGAIGAAATARSEMAGQVIAAAFVAGLVGTLASVLFNSRVNPAVVLSGLAMLAFIGPASGAVIDGANAVRHVYDGTITPLARLTPLHWAAGLLLGVPVGASWASGLVKKV